MSGSADPSKSHRPDTPGARPKRGWAAGRGLVVYLLLVVIVGAGGLAAGVALFHRAYTAPGPLAGETAIVIPRGASVAAISGLLADRGVVAEAALLRYGSRIFAGPEPLQAGEFAFAAGISANDAVRLLQSGKTVVRNLTVPEGLTTRQVMALIAAADGMAGNLPIHGTVGEGQLLPETYQYSWGDERAGMVARMSNAMDTALAELWPQRAAGLPLDTPAQALVLASIVERETALAEERPRIAAVFINRLRRGMRLQSDPTVVYGLSDGLGTIGRPLTRTDLRTDHPYNTYLHGGLPPGPIANPGQESIAAVLQPANSDELYFVADGNGGHAFARTLKEHNRNVAKWRKLNVNKTK